MPVSPGVKQAEDAKEIAVLELSEDLVKQRSLWLERARYARDERESPHREMDGMGYMQDYQSNLDAANTHLTPKKNDDEVRVNTATTEKKLDAIMNELISMNIQPEINAFDEMDREISFLGKDMEHMVLRSNQIEREDDKLVDFYRELVSQRAVFVKETIYEYTSKNGKKVRRAEKNLVPGRKVYLGNINLPAYHFDRQPFIIEYDLVKYDNAMAEWGDNENWDKVKKGAAIASDLSNSSTKYHWTLNTVANDEVEVMRCSSTLNNKEFQVYVAGVPMYDTTETVPWDHEGYDMTMIVVKPSRTNFAYGKSPLSSAKSIQALENETIRNLIRKFRQALEPPIGTMANQIFSRNIWTAGNVTQGVNKTMFDKLTDHDGVTQSEFQMFDLISKKTEEFIGVSNLFQGLQQKGEMTATQAMEQLRQAIKMLGMVVFAAMRLRVNATHLRINNLLENFTDEQGMKMDEKTNKAMKKYRQFTLNDVELSRGVRGKKIVQMSDRDMTDSERKVLKDYEDFESSMGRNVEIRMMNFKKLQEHHVLWYVSAIQKERQGSALNKLMFQDQLNQVAAIEKLSQGQVKANWMKQAENMEAVWGQKDLFQKSAPNDINNPNAVQGNPEASEAQSLMSDLDALEGEQTGIGAQLTEAPRGQTRVPETEEMMAQTGQ